MEATVRINVYTHTHSDSRGSNHIMAPFLLSISGLSHIWTRLYLNRNTHPLCVPLSSTLISIVRLMLIKVSTETNGVLIQSNVTCVLVNYSLHIKMKNTKHVISVGQTFNLIFPRKTFYDGMT